ncbi:hypothetical protein ACIPSJ_35070 [Streptomyces sp. NPDC090088]|uniref:hypothetical protein n=1 Tax=Streptomyces sp. NPDC090088 TaxID=3365944 RepID=UPI003823589A
MTCPCAAGIAAVVAPYDGESPYPRVFARHGWRTVAVVPERRQRPWAYPAAAVPAGHTGAVVHRGVRQTVKALRALGVSAVVAGSAGGIETAERIAWQLGLPGADPASSPLRYDRGAQAARLSRVGIPALRSIRTTSLADALAWARALPRPGYLLAPAAAGTPVAPVECADEVQIGAAWPAMRSAAARQCGSPHLVLSERPSRRQYTVNSATRPGPRGRPEHVVTDLWADVRTRHGLLDRADLLAPGSVLSRTLSAATARVLDALGVVCGPVTTRFVYGDDGRAEDGPLLMWALAAPVVTPADEALRTATGHDRAAEALETWIPAAAPRRLPAPGGQHLVRVRMCPRPASAPWADAVLRSLPTVVAVGEVRTPAGRVPAEAVLCGGELSAVERDYRVIRALERDNSSLTSSLRA